MEQFIQLDPLPTPPTTSDPDNFRVRADSFLSTLPDWSADINTLSGQINTRVALVQGAMNFEGEWTPGTTSLGGHSYSYQGTIWVCIEETNTAPAYDNPLYIRVNDSTASPKNLIINGSLRTDQYARGTKTYSNLLEYYTDGVYAGNKNNGSLELSHATIVHEDISYPSIKGRVAAAISTDVGLTSVFVGRIEANDISLYSTGALTFSALIAVSHAGDYGIIFKKASTAPRAFVASVSLAVGVNRVNITIPGDADFVPVGVNKGFQVVLAGKHLSGNNTATLGWQSDAADLHQYTPGFAWWGIAEATMAIADISLVPGTLAQPKAWPPLSEERARCLRYCEVVSLNGYYSVDIVPNNEYVSSMLYFSEKRATPSRSTVSSTIVGCSLTPFSSTKNSFFFYIRLTDTADDNHSYDVVYLVLAEL